MRRGKAASAVALLLIAAGCGSDKTADFLAERATSSIGGRPGSPSTTIAAGTSTTVAAAISTTTVLAFPVSDLGIAVSLEQRFDGVPNIAKITLQSMQWSATRGLAGGSDPSNGAYLIVTARVECVTGACSPGAGHFIFRGSDGRIYYPFGPGANGHVPALGYGRSSYQIDLARPLTPGQSVTGIAAIDAPRIGGVVYLVGVNALATVTTMKAPNADLRGAVASWNVVP